MIRMKFFTIYCKNTWPKSYDFFFLPLPLPLLLLEVFESPESVENVSELQFRSQIKILQGLKSPS